MKQLNQSIKDRLIQCRLFAALSEKELSLILEEADISFLKEGEHLHTEGDNSNSVSYIIEGKFSVFIRDKTNQMKQLAILDKQAIVGESALFFKGKRVANVKALTEAIVINIPDTQFKKLLYSNFHFKEEITKISLDRMKENFGTLYFKSFFPEASDSLVKILINKMELIDVFKGETLYEKGDESDGIYFLVRGRLKTNLFDPAVQENRDTYFTPGETIGEIGVFSEKNREITVVATRNSYVLKLPIDALSEIKKEHPSITDILLKIMMKRVENVRKGNQYFLNPKTIAIVPLHNTLNTDAFLKNLSQAVSDNDQTSKIADLQFVHQKLNIENFQGITKEDPQYFYLNSMFSAIEKEYDFCFYVVDQKLDVWSKYCLDNADEIILLADSKNSPELTDFENKHLTVNSNEKTPKRLILVHSEELVQPRHTSKWLIPRELLMHHHIKESFRNKDMSRLARFISNQAIGLVLSGGGGRGNAHVGVFDALIDLDIPIDYIGGTSQGSLISATYNAYQFNKNIVERSIRAFQKTFTFDYTLPMVSIFSAKTLERALEVAFGNIQIEDLWTPYFCVSSNLSKNEPCFHRMGRLATAVRSSISLPGIFPPVVIDGDIHVDGGLIFNLPIRPLKEFIRGGTIIASFVIEKEEAQTYELSSLSLSGWRYLWNKFKLFGSGPKISVPGIASILYHSGTVASNYEQIVHEKHSGADLIIKPPVGHFATMNFDQLDEIRAIGYKSTMEGLSYLEKTANETWKHLLKEKHSKTDE